MGIFVWPMEYLAMSFEAIFSHKTVCWNIHLTIFYVETNNWIICYMTNTHSTVLVMDSKIQKTMWTVSINFCELLRITKCYKNRKKTYFLVHIYFENETNNTLTANRIRWAYIHFPFLAENNTSKNTTDIWRMLTKRAL